MYIIVYDRYIGLYIYIYTFHFHQSQLITSTCLQLFVLLGVPFLDPSKNISTFPQFTLWYPMFSFEKKRVQEETNRWVHRCWVFHGRSNKGATEATSTVAARQADDFQQKEAARELQIPCHGIHGTGVLLTYIYQKKLSKCRSIYGNMPYKDPINTSSGRNGKLPIPFQ